LAFTLERERVTEPRFRRVLGELDPSLEARLHRSDLHHGPGLERVRRELLDRLATRDRLRQHGLVVQGSPNRLWSGWNAVVALEFHGITGP